MRAKLIAALLLTLPLWLMLPLAQQVHTERLRLQYGDTGVSREIRDQVGQGMAIALLAGFRGVVADFVWIRSQSFWEKKEWMQQYNNMQLTTLLQPRSVVFWDLGAWHMAWNIGYAERVDTNNYTRAQGLKRELLWHERAREYLERGIENVPNRYDLYFSLGWLYAQKFKDPCRAAPLVARAAQFPEAPGYIARMHARMLEECGDPGRAYESWRELWFRDHQKVNQLWPVVERELKRLEDVLQLPDDQRVFPKNQPQPKPGP
jgi:hypothetical protein